MAAQNIEYASGDSEIESLILHTLPDFGDNGDGITNVNLLTAMLKAKGSYRVKEGGFEFWKGVMVNENTNAKWQGKTDDYSVNLQDPLKRLRWDIKSFTDTIVVTNLDKARNKGKAAIKDLVRTLTEHAKRTIPNKFNSAFWNTAPGANDPDSVPNIINTTNTTGNVGGVSRVGEPALQNGLYSTAIADIGSEAGIADMTKLRLRQAVGNNDMPNLIVMDQDRYSNLRAYLGTLQRYRPNDKMAQLEIETIELGSAIIGWENTSTYQRSTANSITAGYMYGINLNHFFFEILKDGNFKWGDKFERVGVKPVTFLPFEVFCNVTTDLPCAHFVANNLTA